ncbi:unnamed protein product [Boreogadus saida]
MHASACLVCVCVHARVFLCTHAQVRMCVLVCVHDTFLVLFKTDRSVLEFIHNSPDIMDPFRDRYLASLPGTWPAALELSPEVWEETTRYHVPMSLKDRLGVIPTCGQDFDVLVA